MSIYQTNATASTQFSTSDVLRMAREAMANVPQPHVVKMQVGRGVMSRLRKLPTKDIVLRGLPPGDFTIPETMLSGVHIEVGEDLPDCGIVEHWSDGSVKPYVLEEQQ